jgi:predicted methyltransferase
MSSATVRKNSVGLRKPTGDVDHLLHMASRAHILLAEVLGPGELAVDLTTGNGHDACFLFRAVGPEGRVLAFDIQENALQQAAERLAVAGARVFGPFREPPETFAEPGAYLIHGCHARLREFLPQPVAAVIANLGYLPGGAKEIATARDTTLEALRQALSLMAPGGRMAVVAYVGHPGGQVEALAVAELFSTLPAAQWNVLQLLAANRPRAPFLLVAEKRVPFPENPFHTRSN